MYLDVFKNIKEDQFVQQQQGKACLDIVPSEKIDEVNMNVIQ